MSTSTSVKWRGQLANTSGPVPAPWTSRSDATIGRILRHGYRAPPMDVVAAPAAPHTTNWDLPHMLAASLVYRYRLSWLGKDALFRWPFGWFFRMLGGIPVDRSAPRGLGPGLGPGPAPSGAPAPGAEMDDEEERSKSRSRSKSKGTPRRGRDEGRASSLPLPTAALAS